MFLFYFYKCSKTKRICLKYISLPSLAYTNFCIGALLAVSKMLPLMDTAQIASSTNAVTEINKIIISTVNTVDNINKWRYRKDARWLSPSYNQTERTINAAMQEKMEVSRGKAFYYESGCRGLESRRTKVNLVLLNCVGPHLILLK